VIKVVALIAGMIARADNINKMDLLRHGARGRLFTAARAPSTLGTFLQAFTFGHVRHLDAVAARFLINLTERVPLLVGADQSRSSISTTRSRPPRVPEAGRRLRVLQGQGTKRARRDHLHPAVRTVDRGHPPAQGLDLLPAGRVPAGRRRPGSREAGRGHRPDHHADGQRLYVHDVIAAARRGGALFSVTARMEKAVTRAITQIPDNGWLPIKYARAIYDQDEERWFSDAQVN